MEEVNVVLQSVVWRMDEETIDRNAFDRCEHGPLEERIDDIEEVDAVSGGWRNYQLRYVFTIK